MYINKINSYNLSSEQLKTSYKNLASKDLNLDNPKTFTEKIQWLKFYDCTEQKTACADKINLRTICKEKIGKNLCPKILKIYNSINEIEYDELPDRFVLKCNHGCKWNIICEDKSKFNFDEAIEKIKIWYNSDFSNSWDNNEYQYKNIVPKIFLEEYLDIKCEYKVWCFNSKAKLCQLVFADEYPHIENTPKEWNELSTIVDDKFNLTNIRFDYHLAIRPYNINEYINKHYKNYYFKRYDNYLKYSQKLSEEFKFVRVDWYRTKTNKMYLSELTFTPSSGIMNFEDNNMDYCLGEMLDLYA